MPATNSLRTELWRLHLCAPSCSQGSGSYSYSVSKGLIEFIPLATGKVMMEEAPRGEGESLAQTPEMASLSLSM